MEEYTAETYQSLWKDIRTTSFSQGWLDCDGINTRYLKSGDESKPPLLLLHGVGGHAEAYIRNLKAHGEHFHTWAIDLIGHGWTKSPDGPREIRHYVEHVVKFMDAIGVNKMHVSGESIGGWIAAQLAISHPDRVKRIVLNTAAGDRADPEVMKRLNAISMQAAEDPNWKFVKTRIEWLMADKSKANDDLIAVRQAIYSQPNMHQIMTDNMVLQDMKARLRNIISPEDYATIKAETLVLWTSDDPTGDVSAGRRIASLIPGALFTVMDGCGHWPQWEDVETFDRIHLNFLRGLPVPEASPVTS